MSINKNPTLAKTVPSHFSGTQEEIIEYLGQKQVFKTEHFNLPFCKNGLYEVVNNKSQRMSVSTLSLLVKNLFQLRAMVHRVEVKPKDIEVTEEVVTDNNARIYRMTIEDKAALIADYFSRDASVVGFKYTLEGMEENDPSCTVSVYKANYNDLTDVEKVPVDVIIRYRNIRNDIL